MREWRPHTLRFQITVLFTGLVFVFLGAILLINQFFLEDYYITQKEDTLKSSFMKLEKLKNEEGIPDTWIKESSEKLGSIKPGGSHRRRGRRERHVGLSALWLSVRNRWQGEGKDQGSRTERSICDTKE